MKNPYRLISLECPPGGCPAVLEKGKKEVVIIGSRVSTKEEAAMKKYAKVGVARHERTIKIPRAVFDAAVDKLLSERVGA